MSYILEALKMSEQSRRQSAGATPLSLLPAIDEEIEPARSWRHYLLAGTLALNAIAAVLWLRPTTSSAPPADPTPVATPAMAQPAIAAPRVPPAAVASIEDAKPAPTMPPALVASKIDLAPPAPPVAALPSAATSAPPPPPAEPKSVKVAAKATAAPAAAKPETAQEPTTAEGMPTSVQKQLPPISLAGFINDDDANKLVIVNDRLLREGDEVAPGLKLEKIANDGVVFSFKGYRFKR